jgi:hypothetical protein
MSEQRFEDRVARLEEHVVSTRLTGEECLDFAERALAQGRKRNAGSWLRLAQIKHERDELERLLDDMETEEEDDA